MKKPSPSATQLDSNNCGLNINGLSLLTAAAIGFMLVPRQEFLSMTGAWFTIGWPFPTATLKVGYVTPEHFGLHPYFSPFCLLNGALWIGVLIGFRRLARSDRLPLLAFQIARLTIISATYISAGWLSYGVFNVFNVLTSR